MLGGELVKSNFIYEYLYSEDELFRLFCIALQAELNHLRQTPHQRKSRKKETRCELMHVPMENVLLIMSYMDAKSLTYFGMSSRHYLEPSLLDHFWNHLCIHSYCISIHEMKTGSKYVMMGSRVAKKLFVKSFLRFRELLSASHSASSFSLPLFPVEVTAFFGLTAH